MAELELEFDNASSRWWTSHSTTGQISSSSVSVFFIGGGGGGGGGGRGWATAAALLFIVLFHCAKLLFSFYRSPPISDRNPTRTPSFADDPPHPSAAASSGSSLSSSRISEIISEADLRKLIACLDGEANPDEKWENVIDKTNNFLSYKAKCCKPKDGPLKYSSSTVFENCSPDVLKDFYMDNEFRKQWDNTFLQHEQLRVDVYSGIEIGRIIKRFPLLRPREYVMAWKVWEGNNKVFYCIVKECEDPLAPRQKRYARVETFRSGWRIRKVPGTNACEINVVHQEDAGLNEKMTKLVFAKGIWSYVCKMDSALRKYSSGVCSHSGSLMAAVSLIQKVPSELEANCAAVSDLTVAVMGAGHSRTEVVEKDNSRELTRKPSKKLIANSLLLVGGLICFTYGNPSLGAKVAVAYVLKKLNKRGTSPCGRTQDIVLK